METAVPDVRVPVLYVLYILLTRSNDVKVIIFALNQVKIEIDRPGGRTRRYHCIRGVSLGPGGDLKSFSCYLSTCTFNIVEYT
eukprot:SAG31_NODE_6055_length_2190_cov_1.811095_3_plen_83_part_00